MPHPFKEFSLLRHAGEILHVYERRATRCHPTGKSAAEFGRADSTVPAKVPGGHIETSAFALDHGLIPPRYSSMRKDTNELILHDLSPDSGVLAGVGKSFAKISRSLPQLWDPTIRIPHF